MLETDVITSNSAATIPGASGASASGELGRQDFLTMLIAQLENQDPLNPQEGTEFTAQLAQFSSLEQLLEMRESLDALAAVQTQAQALGTVNLIGKNVLLNGSRFQIDDSGQLPTLSYELSQPSEIEQIELIGENGAIAALISDVGSKPPGTHTIDWNDFDVIPQEGIYTVRYTPGPESEVPRSMIETRVTGAALQDGVLYLGEIQAPMSEVREVRD